MVKLFRFNYVCLKNNLAKKGIIVNLKGWNKRLAKVIIYNMITLPIVTSRQTLRQLDKYANPATGKNVYINHGLNSHEP